MSEKAGTRVTATDIQTGESDSIVIENDFVVITDGVMYLDNVSKHANGTVQLTLKRKAATR